LASDATRAAAAYASNFMRELQLDESIEQRCEWTCILWSKDHWASQAKKSAINLLAAKERLMDNDQTLSMLSTNSAFLNTVANVYSRLFDGTERNCPAKNFKACPFLGERDQLLRLGSLASVFVTMLHKAVSYSMLEKHPLDSGLLDEEYSDVYGINLTSYPDLEASLLDGRFSNLFDAVVKRGRQLSGRLCG